MLTFLPQNYCVIEADLEVKLPTHGQMQQQVQEKSEEKESVEKKSHCAKRIGKDRRSRYSRETLCLSNVLGLRRVKKYSRLATAEGAEPSGGIINQKTAARSTFESQKVKTNLLLGTLLEVELFKKCTQRREAHFQVKMLQAPHVRTTFGRQAWDRMKALQQFETR